MPYYVERFVSDKSSVQKLSKVDGFPSENIFRIDFELCPACQLQNQGELSLLFFNYAGIRGYSSVGTVDHLLVFPGFLYMNYDNLFENYWYVFPDLKMSFSTELVFHRHTLYV